MKILLDINVILDAVARSNEHTIASSQCLLAIERKYADGFFSVLSLPTLFYLIHQNYHDKVSSYKLIDTTLENLNILDATKDDALLARASGWRDFEDALLSYSAKRHVIDYIITSNLKDFKSSPVPALSPEQFIKKLQQ